MPVEIEGLSIVPSASIGVAHFSAVTDAAPEVLRLADDAMYEAKRAGGSRIWLHDGEQLREIV